MAKLWTPTGSGEWGIVELAGEAVLLGGGGEAGVRRRQPAQLEPDEALLVPGPTPRKWYLVANPATCDARVNGQRLWLGLRVLQDLDELMVNSRRAIFSTEDLSRVEPFPGRDRPVKCRRCSQTLARDTPVVRCPNCDTYYHMTEEFPCWTYGPKCLVCGRPTELTDTYQWTPEGI